MEIFLEALQFTMTNEGYYSENDNDSGGPTKYGISQSLLYDLFARGEKWVDLNNDGKIDKKDTLLINKEIAEKIYYDCFWENTLLPAIKSKAIAIKLFDASVNIGKYRSAILAQKAVNYYYGNDQIRVDGFLGIHTISSINNINSGIFLDLFIKRQEVFYKNIVEYNPSQQVFLNGWLERSKRLPACA
jgi:lysozyme family protein